MKSIDRRDFLKQATATALGASLLTASSPVLSARDVDKITLPKRRLGKTGYMSTILSLGPGTASLMQPELKQTCLDITNLALDMGINLIDTAESYGNGLSETFLADILDNRRDEVFLCTKTRQRTLSGLEDRVFAGSCERMQTDYVDLYFLHFVNTPRDLDAALDRSDGAIVAFERLREKGKIGYIGISSHSTDVLTMALNRYDFDVVFLTFNAAGLDMNQTPQQAREFIKLADDKDVGIMSMKIPARGRIFRRGLTMKESFAYSVTAGRNGSHFPIATAVIGCSNVDQVYENIDLALNYSPISDDEVLHLEEKAKA